MKIAIVGAGVSGLVTAHLLAPAHEVTVFEAAGYAGGHTNTVRVDTANETHHVDTGFIVFNDRNYPNFERLLRRLEVATQPSPMSFGVSDGRGDFEYTGRLRLRTPVSVVRRGAQGVFVTPHGGEPEHYDDVVLATHSDQALRLLADASDHERRLLGAIPYQANEAVLHTIRRSCRGAAALGRAGTTTSPRLRPSAPGSPTT